MNPDYQRTSVWTTSQKQLLVGSLFRDIDVPKLYFRRINRGRFEYEVIDGQQRLRAIFEYLDNKYPLSEDADNVDGKSVSEKKFNRLQTELQVRLGNATMDVVVMNEKHTDEDIDEMFLRLQNGTPLNAAEKRRAVPGNMGMVVRKMSKHRIFKLCRFKNTRYAYEDAAAKVLHLIISDRITDIKPSSIKKTYRGNQGISATDPSVKRTKTTFNMIYRAFKGKPSPELKKFSIISLALVVDYLRNTYNLGEHIKEFADAYLEFEKKRISNTEKKEEDQDSRLNDYDNAARSDSIPDMEFRHKMLLEEMVKAIPAGVLLMSKGSSSI